MSTAVSTLATTAAPESVWIPSPLYRLTLDQFEAMAASGAFSERDRVQLVNGFLVEKMTQNPPHTVADTLCGDELDRVIPPGWHVRLGQAGPAPRAGHQERARSLRRAGFGT